MFSNLYDSTNDPVTDYGISDTSRPFHEYIKLTRNLIEDRRADLVNAGEHANEIITANCPFEFYPENPIRSGNKLKYGALLIHGLLDCPFSLRDIGTQLSANGILSRAILLPGHGTTSSDLIKVSYHDWIQSVRYGVETLRNEVDQIYLVGYSTGATLSVYQALQDANVTGIVLMSPAIKIKTPIDIFVSWQSLLKLVGRNNKQWLSTSPEDDYAKYQSIPFNAVNQVSNLTKVIQEMRQHHSINTPIFMIVSREDETISSHKAIDFFSTLRNQDSRLLLYTSYDHAYPDPRILTRLTNYPELRINHLSHPSIPYASTNPHYGENGDYIYASRSDLKNCTFGAYNAIEETIFDYLYKYGVCNVERRRLTYNPDFNFMAEKVVGFIKGREQ